MLIQPVKPVTVRIKLDKKQFDCQLISLSETKMELLCLNYLETKNQVIFLARYFRGAARIERIEYSGRFFKYTLQINIIQFQPGFLVDMRL